MKGGIVDADDWSDMTWTGPCLNGGGIAQDPVILEFADGTRSAGGPGTYRAYWRDNEARLKLIAALEAAE